MFTDYYSLIASNPKYLAPSMAIFFSVVLGLAYLLDALSYQISINFKQRA